MPRNPNDNRKQIMEAHMTKEQKKALTYEAMIETIIEGIEKNKITELQTVKGLLTYVIDLNK